MTAHESEAAEAVTGPWLLDVFVPGRPGTAGSKSAMPIYRGRGADREFTGRVAVVDSTGQRGKQWRTDVRDACVAAWAGRPPITVAVVLDVEIVRPRPVSTPKRSTPPAATRPDVLKHARAVEDSITDAGVWSDDALVVDLHARKRLAEIGETPGARIRARLWTPDLRSVDP